MASAVESSPVHVPPGPDHTNLALVASRRHPQTRIYAQVPQQLPTSNTTASPEAARPSNRLRSLNLLEAKARSMFLPESTKPAEKFHGFGMGTVQDDHVPFMQRGVDILHLIPSPFPAVWHTMEDNGQNLDMPTTRDWAKIVTAFAAEWMDLTGMLPQLAPTLEKRTVTNEASTTERTEL
ncbi:hypothetical protein NQ176_g2594 [Zarea fungicola]|uniref:Uncharacterized protein n=1 Tax=Zarea fungicola TaxID=93591 RepID=A0ACC1NQ74_9HYPO|nr:hypothetical protein NQ176_g2594 [Lecanicillium fungicola]